MNIRVLRTDRPLQGAPLHSVRGRFSTDRSKQSAEVRHAGPDDKNAQPIDVVLY